jgi:radical SAM protein with 4Fe4S-binding SPASM domain
VRAAAGALLIGLAYRPERFLALAVPERRALAALLDEALPARLAHYLAITRDTRDPALLARRLEPSYKLSNPPTPRLLLELCAALSDALGTTPGNPPAPETQFETLVALLNGPLGFSGVFLLLDGLDAFPETLHDPTAASAWIAWLLGQAAPWAARRVFLKGFLPNEQAALLAAQMPEVLAGIRRARLEWTSVLLAELIWKRVYVASTGRIGGLDALGGPDVRDVEAQLTQRCRRTGSYQYISKTDEAMDEATGLAAVEAVFRSAVRNGFRAVKLKYASGEATLNFRLVETLHRHACDLAARLELELREVVLSNGVALTRTMIALMRDAGMRLMISLDGIGAAHDAQRVFANGHGSFAVVARAVDRAVTLGLPPHLSITITGRNADHLPKAVAFALDRDLRFNLNFYRENDCSASTTDLAADQARIVAGMRSAFAVIEQRLPRRRLIDGLVDRSAFDEPHEYACGAGHNYMVIDQHGGVARCQMEIERTITDVLADDPLQAIRLEPSGFQNVPVTEKEGCRTCQWRLWCGGGCSLLTFRATGRTDIKSPYCGVYTALYPDVVRLEGLRLLKWAAA